MDHIGIDVHKSASQVCIRTETGQLVERRVRTDRQRCSAPGMGQQSMDKPPTKAKRSADASKAKWTEHPLLETLDRLAKELRQAHSALTQLPNCAERLIIRVRIRIGARATKRTISIG